MINTYSHAKIAIAAATVIVFSVFLLFCSIIMDFILFNQNNETKGQRKSIVDTFTMTLFFGVYYIAIKTRIGAVEIASMTFNNWAMIIGAAMVGFGSAFNIAGRFYLGRNWANHIKIYDEHSLVQEGTYSIVRHPLYSSIMLMMFGGSLALRNIASLVLVMFVFVPFMYYRARQEEVMLAEFFTEYADYKKKTGMFFPRIFKKEKK